MVGGKTRRCYFRFTEHLMYTMKVDACTLLVCALTKQNGFERTNRLTYFSNNAI